MRTIKESQYPIKNLPLTASEAVYRNLKQAIIEGKLKPAQRLRERGIARHFGVSTTPVREAFRRLAAENYLFINEQRGVIVASATEKEIGELFEVIRTLDVSATEKAMDHIAEKELSKLRALTAKLDIYYHEDKFRPYQKANMDFHLEIWKNCQNQFLYLTLKDLSQKAQIFMDHGSLYEEKGLSKESSLYATRRDIFEKSHDEHISLMEAIEKSDKEWVKHILQEHWWGKEKLWEKSAPTNKS